MALCIVFRCAYDEMRKNISNFTAGCKTNVILSITPSSKAKGTKSTSFVRKRRCHNSSSARQRLFTVPPFPAQPKYTPHLLQGDEALNYIMAMVKQSGSETLVAL